MKKTDERLDAIDARLAALELRVASVLQAQLQHEAQINGVLEAVLNVQQHLSRIIGVPPDA